MISCAHAHGTNVCITYKSEKSGAGELSVGKQTLLHIDLRTFKPNDLVQEYVLELDISQ